MSAGEVPAVAGASRGAAPQDIVRKLTPAMVTAPERGIGDGLRAQLESARDAYKGEHEQDAALKAHDLVSGLGHKPGRSEDDEEIRGSAYTLLGLVDCRAGDQASARRHFAAAAQAFGRLPVGRLITTRGATAADYGITLQRTGDHRGAETALRAAMDLGIDTPDLRRHLGAALRDLGKLADADEILTDAVARAPHDWQAAEWLAALHENVGNAASTVGKDWAEVARLLYDAGLPHRAVMASRRAARFYRQVVREQPDDVRLRITAATVIAQSGAQASAARLLLATSDQPMDVPTRLDLGELLLELEKDDAAATAFRAALEAEPDNERAAVGLGWALVAGNDEARRDEAERVLTRAVGAHPESVDARALLGEIASVRGRYAEAIGLFDGALAQNAETTSADAFLHGSKGQALAALGKTADALEELRRAAEINPDLAWVHRALADLYAEADNLDGQIDQLRAASRLGAEPMDLVDLGVALARKAQRLRAFGEEADDIAAEALGLLVERREGFLWFWRVRGVHCADGGRR
jgi:tetratricopeptide (TPR) repeat protein